MLLKLVAGVKNGYESFWCFRCPGMVDFSCFFMRDDELPKGYSTEGSFWASGVARAWGLADPNSCLSVALFSDQ